MEQYNIFKAVDLLDIVNVFEIYLLTASSAKAQRMHMETACSHTDYTFPVLVKMSGERLSR